MGMTQGDGTYLEGDLALEGTGEDWKLDVEWHMVNCWQMKTKLEGVFRRKHTVIYARPLWSPLFLYFVIVQPARRSWRPFIPSQHRHEFYHTEGNSWVLKNLSSHAVTREGWSWPMEFGVTLWHTWKARNQRIFREQAEFQSSPKCNIGSGIVADINRSLVETFSGMEISLADGCSKGNTESAGAGGWFGIAWGPGLRVFSFDVYSSFICSSSQFWRFLKYWSLAISWRLIWITTVVLANLLLAYKPNWYLWLKLLPRDQAWIISN